MGDFTSSHSTVEEEKEDGDGWRMNLMHGARGRATYVILLEYGSLLLGSLKEPDEEPVTAEA